MTFILFINRAFPLPPCLHLINVMSCKTDRAVDNSRLKRAVESAYTAILPKGTSPFVYISLQIDPASVDVNVHPTKREVHFLNEDTIIQGVVDKIQAKLATQSDSRTFEYQVSILLLISCRPEPALITGSTFRHF